MSIRYDFVLSEDDRAILLLILRESRRNKQEVFEAARFMMDSLDRILDILEMSGEEES